MKCRCFLLLWACFHVAVLRAAPQLTDETTPIEPIVVNFTVDKDVFGGAKFYYVILNLRTGSLAARGTMDDGGLDRLILTPNTTYRMVAFYSETLALGGVSFTTPSNGRRFRIPGITFRNQAGLEDEDLDGLPNVHESIVGTSNLNPDTDGDGFLDGAEVIQGKEPLDGYVTSTGVIASAPADSTARDICAINNVAMMAVGTGGVVVYNVRDGEAPVRIAQVDTPGSAEAVTCFSDLVVVADGPEGIAAIDISDPPAAAIVFQRKFSAAATAVTARGNRTFVGLADGDIALIDLFSSLELGRYTSLPRSIGDLAARDDYLYALVSGTLYTFRVVDNEFELIDTDAAPGTTGSIRPRLFLGDGYAYASNQRGYNVFDLTDPANPGLIVTHEAAGMGWKQVVATGSGSAIACVGANEGASGSHDVDLLTVGTDGLGFATDFTYETFGRASAVAIYNGYAYVADGIFGLQVINYQGLDLDGVPPSLELVHNVVDGRLEEGKVFSVFARATDDVQVRNVDFFINDEVIATDGNYPFELGLIAPTIMGEANTFTFKAIAYDTGGNATESASIEVTLMPDATPPEIVATLPGRNAYVGSFDSILISVSETIDPGTIHRGSISLLSAGSDSVLGTEDDENLSDLRFDYDPDSFSIGARLPEPLPVGFYRLTIDDPLADPAGNPLTAPYRTSFRVLGFPDEDSDGVPDELEDELDLDPLKADTDGNGTPDGSEDFDRDGLANAGEVLLGTDPKENDSDDDGTLDGAEDSDLDSLSDGDEITQGTDPTHSDTDRDGIDDGSEALLGTDPLNPDSVIDLQTAALPVTYYNGMIDPGGALTAPLEISLGAEPLTYFNGVVDDPFRDGPLEVSLASDTLTFFNGVVPGVGPVNVWLASDPVTYRVDPPDEPTSTFLNFNPK
jgi:hypothetical protein